MPCSDVITVSRFRQLLEAHELCDKIIDTVARHLDEGVQVQHRTISDASIICTQVTIVITRAISPTHN